MTPKDWKEISPSDFLDKRTGLPTKRKKRAFKDVNEPKVVKPLKRMKKESHEAVKRWREINNQFD